MLAWQQCLQLRALRLGSRSGVQARDPGSWRRYAAGIAFHCQRPQWLERQWPAVRAQLQQVRHRHGRLEHYRFGVLPVKGRLYYRFHKLIGKWNWLKYKERYVAPRALENRQRWVPGTWASYQQARHSKSWYWRLPAGLADAVTPDEVLEVWIKFRHKHPKRTFHYMKVLSRLAEVGGCDPTDWRLKFITRRMRRNHRKVLNLPRLAKFYAGLRATEQLEHLSRFLYPVMAKYSGRQLALAAHAFGLAQMQDKHLFSEIARLLEPKLATLSPSELSRVTQAFAAVEMCHYTLLTRLSSQVQVRVQQSSEDQAPPGSCPSFTQLVEIAEAFARLKLQDYSYFEMCSGQAVQLLSAGQRGPTPPALSQLCAASARLKIHDTDLFELVLAHVMDHWYDYPVSALTQLGAAVAPVLPQDAPLVQEVYRKMFEAIQADCDLLTLRDLELAACFMAEVDHKGEFMPGFAQVLAKRLKELRDDTTDSYDVARVIEVFGRRFPEDRRLFSVLCKHMHRHLGFFEPVDFIRFVRGLSLAEYRDDRVTHALGKWARKRREEFSQADWAAFLRALESLGVSEKRTASLKEIPAPVALPPGMFPMASAASSYGRPVAAASQ